MFCVVLLQIILGISWTYFTVTTSIHVCTIVCVGTIITCCLFLCSQYQLVSSCIHIRYCTLTASSPAEIIFPSHVQSHCKVYVSETNSITYYSIVDGSVVFMAPYLPYLTNEAVLSLMTSRKNCLISSKSLLVVGFFWQCDDIPVVKGAKNWSVRAIDDRPVVWLIFLCQTMNPEFV